MLRDMGIANAPSAARWWWRCPSPPCLVVVVAISSVWFGSVLLLVSVMNRRKNSFVVWMVLRNGVVHVVGSPGGGWPFSLYVLSISAPIRWAIAGCAQYRYIELIVCRSSSRVVMRLTLSWYFIACWFR